MLFRDNCMKKFGEEFSKVLIISAYGRNNWSKRKVNRVKYHLTCFRNTINSSQFRRTKINVLIHILIKKIFVIDIPQKILQLPLSS